MLASEPGRSARTVVMLSSSSVYPESTARAFELAAELGYDGVEIMVTGDRQTQSESQLRYLGDRHGLPVLAVHSPCLLVSTPVWSSDPLVKLSRSVQMAEAVGAAVVVVHPPFVWQRAAAAAFPEAVQLLQESTAVRIAVENEYPQRRAGREFSLYRPHWDPTMAPYPWYTLDLSHTAASGSDAIAMARRMGNRLTHLHLADGALLGADQHLPPGEGDQPCRDVLRLVRGIPAATVCVEITTMLRTVPDRRAALERSLCLAREVLDGP